MRHPVHLGTFTDDASFVALLGERKDALGLSNATLDDLAGFCDGRADKLLGSSATKGVGASTFGPLLDALGLSGTLYADSQKVARVAGRWEKRQAKAAHENGRIAKAAVARGRPVVLRELARKAVCRDGRRPQWRPGCKASYGYDEVTHPRPPGERLPRSR
jgi:hypothetical protein